MGKIKSVLAYTNPIAIVLGIPVFVGIVIAAMTDGVFKKTTKVVKSLNKDL